MNSSGKHRPIANGPAARLLLTVLAVLQLAGGLVVPVSMSNPVASGVVPAKICPCAPVEKPVSCCCGTGCCSTPEEIFSEQPQAGDEQAPRLLLVPVMAVKKCRGGDEGVSASADPGPLFLQALPGIVLAPSPVIDALPRSELPVSRADSPDSPPPRS